MVVGLLAGLLMARRGYDPLWVLLALPLGPLFVPIALERIRRRPEVADFGAMGEPPRRTLGAAGSRVLVGMDGSVQSDRALETALALVGSDCSLLVLAEVVPFDATEAVTRDVIDGAKDRLAGVASGVTTAGVVHTEVLTGPPGPTLRRFAQEQDMDLLVVGRRGEGHVRTDAGHRVGRPRRALHGPGVGDRAEPRAPGPGPEDRPGPEPGALGDGCAGRRHRRLAPRPAGP